MQNNNSKEMAEKEKLMEVHSTSRHNKALKNVPSFVSFKLLNEEQAQRNHSQSLDKLNSRGGLGVLEILDIIHKRKWSHRTETQQEVDELNSIISKSKEQNSKPIAEGETVLKWIKSSDEPIPTGRQVILKKEDGSMITEISHSGWYPNNYMWAKEVTLPLSVNMPSVESICLKISQLKSDLTFGQIGHELHEWLRSQITLSKGEDEKEKLVLCGFCKTPIHVDAYGGERKDVGSFHGNCLIANEAEKIIADLTQQLKGGLDAGKVEEILERIENEGWNYNPVRLEWQKYDKANEKWIYATKEKLTSLIAIPTNSQSKQK